MSSIGSKQSGDGAGRSRARLDFQATRRGFDRTVARQGTRWDLADEISRRMAERLDYLRLAPLHILDAGCGSGPSALLEKRFPSALLTGVDASRKMLVPGRRSESFKARFKRVLGTGFRSNRINTVCGDACALPLADSSVDMVWSNLAFAWFSDASMAFREFRRVLRDGGLLMFSTYGPDTLRELKAAFASVDPGTHVHEFADMHDLGDDLFGNGFADPVMDMDRVIYTYPDVAALIGDLRASGQVNVASERRRGLMSPLVWRAMETAYQRRAADGRIEATFEISYGHAWKVAGRAGTGKSSNEVATIQWLPGHRKEA